MTTNNDDSFDPRLEGWAIRKPTWHFHKQLYLRYGIIMEHGEFSEMLRDIAKGRAPLIEERGPGLAVYSVRIRRLYERFYVLMKDGRVVTALPARKRLNAKRRALDW